MKARSFALITTAILLCAAALAGSASDIDNCCFAGWQCGSNQDWINGWHAYRAGQCSAPAQSGASGGAAAQIDNCCFAGWQCHTDQDWTNGWHAYRNNQCGAPARSPVPASSQPAGGAPAHVDNCCFVNRQCHSDQDWINGWQAYRNGQCGAPGQAQTAASYQTGGGNILRSASGIVIGHSGGGGILPTTEPYNWPALGEVWSTSSCCDFTWQCNNAQDRAEGLRVYQTNLPNVYCPLPGLISIVGDPDFISFYEQRVALLRNRAPQRYNYVLEGLNKIEQNRSPYRGTHVSIVDRIYFVTWGGTASNEWITLDSAVLVREACRVHAYDAKVRFHNFNQDVYNREDVVCREMELATLNELGAPPHVIERSRRELASARARV